MNKDFHFCRFTNEFNVTIFFIVRIAEQRDAEKSGLPGVRQAQRSATHDDRNENTRRLKYTLQFSCLLYTRKLYTNLHPSPSISLPR